MNRIVAILCLVHCVLCGNAQEVQRAVMLGAGVANTYDTYLSPLEYRGPQLTLSRESFRMTHWKRIATQGSFSLTGSYTSNRAENGHAMGGTLGYRQSWFYTWTTSSHWTLMAGGGAGGAVGFLYNVRNTANNPAQAQLDASLHASLAARYTWRWLAVRAQVDAPFMGLMFAPNYGQSYYEMFGQGNGDSNVVFTHPANNPTMHAMLTADCKLKRATVRIGYGADIIQATPNNLRRHTYLHSGYVGFVRNFKIMR